MLDDKKIKPILTLCEYGKIQIDIKTVMDNRGITRNQLARQTNTRFEVVNKWYEGSVERIDVDILARFCYALGCEVNELIKYIPQ